jgi:exoribonuclease-2
VLPEHHNYLLDQAGYDTGEDWAGEHQGLCAEIRSKAAALLRETPLDADPAADGGVDAMPLFSIDPPSTRDWDDALAARRTQAGYAVSIAIACPSLFWPFGSDLDKKTLRRASSLYFPEGDLFMLPRDICDLFSLRARQHRPALLLEVELDEDMTIKGLVPSVQCLRVQDNLSLGSCETILAEKEGASGSVLPGLSMAYALALRLREKRLARGAIVTERHEPDILLHKEAEGGISVRVAPGADYERGHTLVSEFMILYNAALAEWGLAAGIPLVYRTQAGAVSKEHSGVWTRPHEISRALQGLPPAKLSVEPKAHAGVGAGLYSSFTSPLRRYLDLLNQAQIVHYLRHGRPRLDQTELAALLPLVVSRLESVGKIQRFRLRYWKLVYMQQEQRSKGGPYFWEGVITDESNNMVSVMLHPLELSLRGPRALFGGRVMPGAGVGVRVGKINPLRNEIQIMEVTEL